jgi:hypothetical protein
MVALASGAWPSPEVWCGVDVGHEPEPVQVVEDPGLEGRTAALTIVILYSQQDAPGHPPGNAPYSYGIEHVTQMEPARQRLEVDITRHEQNRDWVS